MNKPQKETTHVTPAKIPKGRIARKPAQALRSACGEQACTAARVERGLASGVGVSTHARRRGGSGRRYCFLYLSISGFRSSEIQTYSTLLRLSACVSVMEVKPFKPSWEFSSLPRLSACSSVMEVNPFKTR